MTVEPPREPDPVPKFIGWALIVVGVLWMAFSGICSAALILMPGGTDPSMIALVLVIGGISAVAGFGVFMLGRALSRS